VCIALLGKSREEATPISFDPETTVLESKAADGDGAARYFVVVWQVEYMAADRVVADVSRRGRCLLEVRFDFCFSESSASGNSARVTAASSLLVDAVSCVAAGSGAPECAEQTGWGLLEGSVSSRSGDWL
jgi:hypothetical protein